MPPQTPSREPLYAIGGHTLIIEGQEFKTAKFQAFDNFLKMRKCIIILCFFISQIVAAQPSKQQAKNNTHVTTKKTFSIDEPTAFTCDELINYRDKTLAKQFESAYNKYTLSLGAKEDLVDIKKHLLDDKASWYQLLSTNAASSEWASMYAQFVNIWKLLADKYQFILKQLSGNSLINTGLEYGTKNQEYWYGFLNTGKSIYKAVTENSEKEAYKMALSKNKETKKLSDAINAALDFSSNLESFQKLEKDRTELKSEIKRLLDMIDIRYIEYEESINSSRETQNSINEVVKAIDKYLLEKNCKPPDAIEETLQKELSKKPIQDNAISAQPNKTTPTQNNTSYFIFLTADISINVQQSLFSNLQTPKHLHVISKPIWYTQNQTDENSIKETFLRQIENQVKNLDKDFYKNFSRNNYESVGYINTNFKESIPLLNNQQCEEALVNYKNLTLNIDKTAEFMQLQ